MVLKEQDHPDDEDEDDGEDDEDDEDEDEEEMDPEEKKIAEKQKQKAKQCTVLVELLQKNRRQTGKLNFLYIAYHIYRVRTSLYLFSTLDLSTFILVLEKLKCLCFFCIAGSP